jgi:hypothetical protein
MSRKRGRLMPAAGDDSNSQPGPKGMAARTKAVLVAIAAAVSGYAAFSGNINTSIENTLRMIFPPKATIAIRSVETGTGIFLGDNYNNDLRIVIHKEGTYPVEQCFVLIGFPAAAIRKTYVALKYEHVLYLSIGCGSQDKEIDGTITMPAVWMRYYFHGKLSGTSNGIYLGGRDKLQLSCNKDGIITEWFEFDLQPPPGFAG